MAQWPELGRKWDHRSLKRILIRIREQFLCANKLLQKENSFKIFTVAQAFMCFILLMLMLIQLFAWFLREICLDFVHWNCFWKKKSTSFQRAHLDTTLLYYFNMTTTIVNRIAEKCYAVLYSKKKKNLLMNIIIQFDVLFYQWWV